MANEGRRVKKNLKQGWITDTWGDKKHYINDELHSINDEPSAIYAWGSESWHKEGRLHRESGPAIVWPDGRKEYLFEGLYYPDITSDLEWLMKVEELKRCK